MPVESISCEWDGCASSAISHVRYGRAFFDEGDQEFAAKLPSIPFHANMCDLHVDELRRRFLDVTLFEIGGCPESCSCR